MGHNYLGAERRLFIGGWSYGGVVASNLVHALARRRTDVEVRGLVLYDAPLRARRTGESLPFNATDDASLAAVRHFDGCIALLQS